MDSHLAVLRANVQTVEGHALQAALTANKDVAAARSQVREELQQRAVIERQSAPEVIGGCDGVLVHHFGALAFDQEIENCLRSLHSRIVTAAERDGDVPMLFFYSTEDGQRIAALRVPNEAVATPFRSTARQERMSMHAFTQETEMVETLTLAIRGTAVSIPESIDRPIRSLPANTESLVIRETAIAANGRGSGYGTYCFSNHYNDTIFQFAKLHDGTAPKTQLVGFNEIATHLDLGHYGQEAYRTTAALLAAVGLKSFGADSREDFIDSVRRHRQNTRS